MKRMKYIGYLLFFGGLVMLLQGCEQETSLLKQQQQIQDETLTIEQLKNTLCDAPNGWHVIYFPKVNYQLNTDITENYKTEHHFAVFRVLLKRMGVGGYNIFVKFNKDGTGKILSDIAYKEKDRETSYNPQYQRQISDMQYDIRIADGLTLFFTTNTMLDQLKLLNINAETRFSPVVMRNDSIIMRTLNYKKGDREQELIIFKKNTIPLEKWESAMERFIIQKKIFRNRGFEDNTFSRKEKRKCVFQVKLKDKQDILYQTNVDINKGLIGDRLMWAVSKNPLTDALIAYYDRIQYEIFLRNEQPDRTVGDVDNSTYYTGLGSGYAATSDGLFFFPGLKYDDDVVFNRFVLTPGKKEWKSTCNNYEASILFVQDN